MYIFKYFEQRRLGEERKNPCEWIVQHINENIPNMTSTRS